MTVPAPLPAVARLVPLAEWASLHAHLVWVYDGPVSPQGRRGRVSAFDLTAWLIRAGHVTVRLGAHLAGQGWRVAVPSAR